MVNLKEIIISVDDFETRAAIIEDGALAEIYIERHKQGSIVGNIYLGVIKDVLPGMEAAFVDIGLGRNAFLFIEEVIFPAEEHFSSQASKIQRVLKQGQNIVVQVIKEPMGSKGARVTTQVTLPGRYLVLMPFSGLVGVSRKLSEDNRETLRKMAEEIKPENAGIIIRTAAQGVTQDELLRDLRYLSNLWESLQSRIKTSKAPSLIYQEADLSLKVVRDIFSADYKYLVVDSEEIFQKILEFLSNTNPELKSRLKLHKEKIPLFDKFNIGDQVSRALKRRVWLRSGGYITIDHTEALTAIDVNTGKFIGKKSLEDTIFKTNLEAAKEIVRQIRLRDIGGIIVIDFIDMQEAAHKEELFATFEEALKEDRTKTQVIEISSLGLVEMTRKNVAEGLLDFLCEPCPLCEGLGQIPSVETLSIEITRKINKRLILSDEEAFVFHVNSKVAQMLKAAKGGAIKKLEESSKKSIFLVENDFLPQEELELLGQGKREEMERLSESFLNGNNR